MAIRSRLERFHIGRWIYHADYNAVKVVTGVEVNLADDKAQIIAFDEEVTVGHYKTLSETEDFLKVQTFAKLNREVFFNNTASITYRDSKVITRNLNRKIWIMVLVKTKTATRNTKSNFLPGKQKCKNYVRLL